MMEGWGDRTSVSCQTSWKVPVFEENAVEKSTETGTNNGSDANGSRRLIPALSHISTYFKEYCSASGLHGVRYLSEDRRNIVEKLFWITALTLCAVGCAFMIVKVKAKLDDTPVIITFEERATNIWKLPFPAVTICPLTKSSQTVFEFTKYAPKLNRNESIYEDYTEWVGKIILESSFLRKDFLTEFKAGVNFVNSTTKERLALKVKPFTYGNVLKEELASLLESICFFMMTDSGADNSPNLTWAKQKLTEWSKDDDFRKYLDDYYPTWHQELYQKLRAFYLVCDHSYTNLSNIFRGNESAFSTLDEDALEFLIKVSPDLGKYGAYVRWGGVSYNPLQFLDPIWTAEGLCLTFNMMNYKEIYNDGVLNHTTTIAYHLGNPATDHVLFGSRRNDWHPDKWFSPNAGRNTFPRRPLGIGSKAGLKLLLIDQAEDLDYFCRRGATGYRVILHRPDEHPQPDLNFDVDVPFMKQVSVSVNPIVMKTSSGLENYDPQKRQCYFSHENHLEYFKFYSKNNCELECLTKATLEMCNCVAFYMPRNAATRICGYSSHVCMRKAAKNIEEREIVDDVEAQPKSESGTFNSAITKMKCDCLPSCTSISYEADVTMVDLDNKYYDKVGGSWNNSRKLHKESRSHIKIVFKNKHFIASRRSELYGKIDFLANCGGLLGLFCGFSLISFIEFVYFLTLRLWSSLYQRWSNARKVHRKPSSAIC